MSKERVRRLADEQGFEREDLIEMVAGYAEQAQDFACMLIDSTFTMYMRRRPTVEEVEAIYRRHSLSMIDPVTWQNAVFADVYQRAGQQKAQGSH